MMRFAKRGVYAALVGRDIMMNILKIKTAKEIKNGNLY
jgi:hypothetical protein